MKRLLVCLLLVGVVGCGKSDADKARTELNKGVGLFDLKDWATAIACCNEAIRIKPDYADAYYNRGSFTLTKDSTTRRLRITPKRFE